MNCRENHVPGNTDFEQFVQIIIIITNTFFFFFIILCTMFCIVNEAISFVMNALTATGSEFWFIECWSNDTPYTSIWESILLQQGRYLTFRTEAGSVGVSTVMEEHASQGACTLIDSAEVWMFLFTFQSQAWGV